MSTQPNALSRSRAVLSLEYPMSLGRYDSYEKAQRAVDYLSDHEFPSRTCSSSGPTSSSSSA
jgi:hypothetical protein